MVQPVGQPSLSPSNGSVKRARAPRRQARQSRLIEPIKKTRVSEEIANRVRLLMLDGTFQPGRPLPGERDLAARFKVSRGSVRDAFRTLEMIGLLETRHGQGTFRTSCRSSAS